MSPESWSVVWSIVSGVISLTLGIVAIWLSLYFYTKGKDTERSVTNALADIKSQTAALERLSSKQLDRLTKFATEVRPNDLAMAELARTFKEMTLTISQPAPSPTNSSAERLQADVMLANFQSMYFAGLLNAVMAAGLQEIDTSDSGYGWACGLIEQSYMFFRNSEPRLRQADLSLLEQNGGTALAHEVLNDVSPLVRNVLMAQNSTISN